MPSLHIEAQPGDIAETILLAGDPLRAQHIAETFLTNAVCFNRVRNMFGFTGTYEGKRVSVMGTGMGVPSMGIYAHELIAEHGVRNLIRIGTAGALQERVRVRDLVICQASSTDSNFGKQFDPHSTVAAVSDYGLLSRAVRAAESMGLRYHVGGFFCSDIFYNADPDLWKRWQKLGMLCVEMEAYALLLTASYLNARALVIDTISDSLVTGDSISAEDRQNSLADMVRVALELV